MDRTEALVTPGFSDLRKLITENKESGYEVTNFNPQLNFTEGYCFYAARFMCRIVLFITRYPSDDNTKVIGSCRLLCSKWLLVRQPALALALALALAGLLIRQSHKKEQLTWG